jgi:RNA recognition motif-containing protein
MLHELIETRGFGVKCDFLYLPIDFHTQSNLGYAFVNLERAEDARTFWDVFEGFNKWAMRSKKVGSLRWSECQGLEANINRYRNSPVMGEAVPDRHKPAVYSDGQRMEFPPPTKPLRAPRIKQVAQK